MSPVSIPAYFLDSGLPRNNTEWLEVCSFPLRAAQCHTMDRIKHHTCLASEGRRFLREGPVKPESVKFSDHGAGTEMTKELPDRSPQSSKL